MAGTFPALFVLLYAAHLLADYPLQTDHMAAHKADRCAAGWRANVEHAACHVAVTALLLWAVGGLALDLHPSTAAKVTAVAWVGVSHGFIDRRWPVARWMAVARQSRFAEHGGGTHVDQAFHIALGLLPAALVLATL